MNNADPVGRERECDRCERDIHDLEPAAVLSFSAAIETDELVVCLDCANLLVEWWNERPVSTEADADD